MEKRQWLRNWCEQVWAEHKYLVMLSSYRHYREIASRFQEASRTGEWDDFANRLLADLQNCSAMPEDAGNARNALAHAFGHLKRQIPSQEAARWHQLLGEDWRRAWEELFLLAMRHGDDYLTRSRLFSPAAPAGHVWIRWKKQDCLVLKGMGTQERLLSADEVRERLPLLTEEEKDEYRLTARLGKLASPLAIYNNLTRGEK